MSDRIEMKRPFCVGMKTGENKYKVFQIIDWKVRGEFNLEGGSCDCTMYRFGSSCDHSKMIDNHGPLRMGRDDGTGMGSLWDDEPTSDWREDEPYSRMVLWTEEDGLVEVAPQLGNVGIAALADLFSEGRIHDPDAELDEVITGHVLSEPFNPKRVYAECMAALTGGGLTIMDEPVSAVGAVVAPAASPKVTDLHHKSDSKDALEEVVETVEEPVDIDSLPIWDSRRTPKPEANQFYVDTAVWEQILYSLSSGKNVLLTGPSGSGKSELAYIAAKALEVDLEAFNMGAMSEPRSSLIGNTHFDKEKGTWFDESRFAKTVQNDDGVVLLDEITRSEPGAFNILLPLMDRQGYLPLDESEDGHVINRGENVAFIATANIGMEYTGTMAMDKALKDRFAVTIDMEFPPESNEVGILTGRCDGLKKVDAKRLVKVATRQRELARDGEFIEQISTRMLLEVGEQIAAGVNFRTACKFCIENQFSADGGDASDRTKIRQIIQKDDA